MSPVRWCERMWRRGQECMIEHSICVYIEALCVAPLLCSQISTSRNKHITDHDHQSVSVAPAMHRFLAVTLVCNISVPCSVRHE